MVRVLFFGFMLLLLMISGAEAVIPADRHGLLWWEMKEDTKSDEAPVDWRDFRKTRLKQQVFRGKVKKFFLCWGDIPFGNTVRKSRVSLKPEMMLEKAFVWVRDADGRISQAALNSGKDGFSVNIPADIELNGLYLLDAHLDIGEMDIDSDGVSERVYLSAKRLIFHYKTGGRQGSQWGVFFDEQDKLPLEIGGSDDWFRYGYQRAYRGYEMKVIYLGKPLADAEVNIFSKSGWKKTMRTDSRGRFLITPFGNMGNNEQEEYLYLITHYEPVKREFHTATLMMNVQTNPEWLSKSGGFVLWTIMGMGLLVIIVCVGIYRKKKYDREAIIKFENHSIKKV